MHVELSPRAIGDKISNGVTEFKGKDHAVRKKITASWILGSTKFGLDYLVGIPFAIKEQGLVPDKFNNAGSLGVIFGFGAVVGLICAIQQGRLLKRFEMNSDGVSTSAYHGLGKSFLKEKRTIRSVAAVSIPAIVSFALSAGPYFSIAALYPERIAAAILLRTGQEASDLTQSGIMEIILRTVGRKKETESKAKELSLDIGGGMMESKGVVFEQVRQKT